MRKVHVVCGVDDRCIISEQSLSQHFEKKLNISLHIDLINYYLMMRKSE